MAKKNLQIRNSTAEFLIFTAQANESTIEVMVEDETVWLSQKMLATLFEVEVNTINYHIKEIYKSAELQEAATIRIFRIVQTEGKREVTRDTLLPKLMSGEVRVRAGLPPAPDVEGQLQGIAPTNKSTE